MANSTKVITPTAKRAKIGRWVANEIPMAAVHTMTEARAEMRERPIAP